jgi:hypothetical protein
MGMDFDAYLRYDVKAAVAAGAVDDIEAKGIPDSAKVAALWRQYDFAPTHLRKPQWFLDTPSLTECARPILPCLDKCLLTPDHFILVFGRDALKVGHSLRWHTFLTDATWQQTLLSAMTLLASTVGASGGVITSDFSPLLDAFYDGQSYDQIVAAGTGIDGEKAKLSDLYEQIDEHTWDSHGYWRFLGK